VIVDITIVDLMVRMEQVVVEGIVVTQTDVKVEIDGQRHQHHVGTVEVFTTRKDTQGVTVLTTGYNLTREAEAAPLLDALRVLL
jgi:hypothetical protein